MFVYATEFKGLHCFQRKPIIIHFIFWHNMSYSAIWLALSKYIISKYFVSAVSSYTLKAGGSKFDV